VSDEIEPGPGNARPASYQIRLRGELGADWSDWFCGLGLTTDAGDTLLAGPMDQATLHGVLSRVRDLGLTLISVSRLEEP
jgi:hypothetical protein